MQLISLVWGILAISGFMIGFVPCLGWMNWFNIPFSAAGLVFGIVAFNMGQPGRRSAASWGIVLCAIGVLIGAKRLILGGGVL